MDAAADALLIPRPLMAFYVDECGLPMRPDGQFDLAEVLAIGERLDNRRRLDAESAMRALMVALSA